MNVEHIVPHRVARWLALALLASAGRPAIAQTATSLDSIDLNIPYLHRYGTGGYQLDDQRVFTVGVRAQPTLVRFEDHSVGLTLRITSTLGWQGTPFPDDASTVRFFSFVPGVSIDILAAERLLLRPFADVGFARVADTDQWVGVSGMGILAAWLFPWRRFELALEPQLEYTFTTSKDRLLEDELLTASLRFDVRHPLWFRWMGAQTDVGGYLEAAALWGDTDLAPSIGQTIDVRRYVELGLSFGQNPRPKIWFIRVPRFTVAFRYAGDFRGLRLSLGDRKLRLPPR